MVSLPLSRTGSAHRTRPVSSSRRPQSQLGSPTRSDARSETQRGDASEHGTDGPAAGPAEAQIPTTTLQILRGETPTAGASVRREGEGVSTVWTYGSPWCCGASGRSGRVHGVVSGGCRSATADGDVADKRRSPGNPGLKRGDLPWRRFHRAPSTGSCSRDAHHCPRPRRGNRRPDGPTLALESTRQWAGQHDRHLRAADLPGRRLQHGRRSATAKRCGRRPTPRTCQTVEPEHRRRGERDQDRPLGRCLRGRGVRPRCRRTTPPPGQALPDRCFEVMGAQRQPGRRRGLPAPLPRQGAHSGVLAARASALHRRPLRQGRRGGSKRGRQDLANPPQTGAGVQPQHLRQRQLPSLHHHRDPPRLHHHPNL